MTPILIFLSLLLLEILILGIRDQLEDRKLVKRIAEERINFIFYEGGYYSKDYFELKDGKLFPKW